MANYIEDTQVLTNDQDVMCAWCLAHQGLPMGSGSHGICATHADIMRVKSQMRKYRLKCKQMQQHLKVEVSGDSAFVSLRSRSLIGSWCRQKCLKSARKSRKDVQ